MDALKRAEKARQAQAEKNAEGQDSSTSELTMDPIEVDPPGSGGADAAPSEAEPYEPEPASASAETSARRSEAPPPDADPAPAVGDPATTHFSLEDDFPSTEKAPPPKSAGGAPEPASGDQQEEKLGPFSLLRDDELSLEDTGEMLPVVKEAERSLNRYFDQPDSATTTAGPEKTFGDDDSTVLGGRGSRESDSQAQQAAESVFKAKAPAVARYQRNRKLMLVLPLLLIGVIVVGLFVFWGPLERAIFGAPPVLVQRPPGATELPPPQAAPPVDPAKLAAAAAAASAGPQPVQPAPSAQAAAPSSTVPETAAAGSAGAQKPVREAPAAAAPVATAGDVTPAGGVAKTVTKPASAAPPRSPSSVSEPPPVMARPFAGATASGVRISRRSRPDTVHAGIHEAYSAFQRGDDARARALYAEVRRQHPNNRNALLGLGAIAMRGGNYSEAIEHYARLLSINPQDAIAGAALINLNQRVPAGEGESHVKRLLAEDPEQPFLHFTLGNLYSRQGRWLEAQQAYFDAYRRDSENADIAFNLAVSLDRLGEATTALTYYHRALTLAAEKPASFELSAARKRIQRLTSGGPG